MTFDSSSFAATSTATALVSSTDMRREQGSLPVCYPISSSSSSQFNGLLKLMMKPKFLVPNFDMIEPRKYIIVASRGRLSVHCVAGLEELLASVTQST